VNRVHFPQLAHLPVRDQRMKQPLIASCILTGLWTLDEVLTEGSLCLSQVSSSYNVDSVESVLNEPALRLCAKLYKLAMCKGEQKHLFKSRAKSVLNKLARDLEMTRPKPYISDNEQRTVVAAF
jgi:hypothetical protein